jgi:hypothetical protein
MIGKMIHASFLSIIFSMLLFCVVPSAKAAQCTQAGAAGKYGFTLTGVLILPTGPVPLAAVGRATVDASGNVTGTEARSVGGQYADETLSGTLTANGDCTGSMTLNFYENGQLVRTSVLSTVTDSNGRELRMVQKSLTLPNGAVLPVVITVEARRITSDDED